MLKEVFLRPLHSKASLVRTAMLVIGVFPESLALLRMGEEVDDAAVPVISGPTAFQDTTKLGFVLRTPLLHWPHISS